MSGLGENKDATKETVSETMDEGSSACDGSHEKGTNLSRCGHENTCEARETHGIEKAQPQGAETNKISGIPARKSLSEDGSHNPVPSVLSMKSDRSMGLPGNFKGDLTQDTQIHLDQLDSSSIVSSAITSNVSEQWISSRVYHPVVPHGGVPCDVCPKKAVKSCLTCCASFCEEHIKMHYTAPALQRHKLVEATRDLEERLCQQHSRHLELFCRTDNALICALCSVEEHRGHEITVDPKELDVIQIVQMKEPEWVIKEELPPPGPIKFSSVKADSVTMSWDTPEGQTGSQRFRVSVKCSREQRCLEVQNLKLHLQGLAPHEEYDCMVASVYGEHIQSTWVSKSLCTVVPVPKGLTVTTGETFISVTWKPDGLDHVSYLVTLSKSHECLQTISTEALECSFSELLPGTKYTIEAVSVLKNGYKSEAAVTSCHTKIYGPENLKIDSVTTTTISLSWSLSDEMDQVPHTFLITYHQYSQDLFDNMEPETISTDSCHGVITGLKPYTEYTVFVSTIVGNVGKSAKARIYALTGVLPATDIAVYLHSSTARIHWEHQQQHKLQQHSCIFLISCHSDESDLLSEKNNFPPACFQQLKPNTEYTLTVTATAILKRNQPSDPVSEIKGNPVSTSFVTGLPPPGPIQFTLVRPDSVSFTWGLPEGLTSHPKFKVSLCHVTDRNQNNQINLPGRHVVRASYCSTDEKDSHYMIVHCLQATFDGLNPGAKYNATVATLSEEGEIESLSVSARTQTVVPEPVDLDLNFEDLSLTWGQPAGVFGKSYQLSFFRDEKCFNTITTPSLTWPLADLHFETEYTIKISTLMGHGPKSKPLSKTIYIETPTPKNFDVDSVSDISAELSWRMPCGMTQFPHSFLISYHSEGTEPQSITADSCSAVITGLTPDTEYTVSVSTILQNGGKSQPATTTMHTDPPAPGPVQFSAVTSESVNLCWERPTGLRGSQRFRVSYTEMVTARVCSFVVPGLSICVQDLMPGEEYKFCVSTVSDSGKQSCIVTATTCTDVPVPEELTVELRRESVAVAWKKPARLDEVSYLLTLYSDGQCKQTVSTKSVMFLFSNLQFDTEYTVSVCSVLASGRQSKPVSDVIRQWKMPRLAEVAEVVRS